MNRIKLSGRALKVTAVGGLAAAASALAVIAAQASGIGGLPFANVSLLAASPSPSPSGGARVQWCQVFLGHLSGDLGVSQPTLEAKIKDAAKQTVQDAVTKGKLSQAQATRIESRLTSGSLCSSRIDRLGHRPPAGLRHDLVGAASAVLKMTPEQLMADLRQGQSLSQIAQAHGISTESAFRTALIGSLTPQLDAAVKAGKITSAQESAILKRLQTAPIPFWNHGLPGHPQDAQPPTGGSSTT